MAVSSRVFRSWAFLFVLGLAAAAQAQPEASPKPNAEHPMSGVFTDDLEDEKKGHRIIHYKMRVPDPMPEQKHLGLIVYFHGRGGNEESLYGLVTGGLERTGLLDQYIVMGAKSKSDGWEQADDEPVLQWVDWVLQTYPVDPRRVHLIGYSSGAFMVTRFGWINQERFATVTAFCGASDFRRSSGVKKPKGPAEDTRTEFYFIHGTEDDQVDVGRSRDAVKVLGEQGYRYLYREIKGGDHGSIGGEKAVVDDIVRWMHASRHKEIPVTADERKGILAIRGALSSASGEEGLAMIAELERVGGMWAEAAVSKAYGLEDLSLRHAALASAQRTVYGRGGANDLAGLLRDKNAETRQLAIAALGEWGNWRYAEAQDALEKFAKNRDKASEERVLAVKALARPLPLMARGNWKDDPNIVWALVDLLDEADAPVRAAAFEALSKVEKEAYGYNPAAEPAEMKEAIRQWKTWALNTVGPQKGAPVRRSR